MSNTTLNNDVNNIGFISATIATIMTVIFAISLVMDFFHILPSRSTYNYGINTEIRNTDPISLDSSYCKTLTTGIHSFF